MRLSVFATATAIALSSFAGPAAAEIKVGVIVAATGAAAAAGVPMQKSVALLPKTIAGEPVTYIVLDSNTDATKAAANARKLTTEDNVDLLIGEVTTPGSLALIDIVAERQVPLIAPTPSVLMIQPQDEKRRWVFKIVPNDEVGARAITKYMAQQGHKTIGYIGFNDAYGQGWYDIIKVLFPEAGMQFIANEVYQRTDTSTAAQALKLASAKPDAVFVAGSAASAVIPARDLRQRGYTGPIYQTHGAAFQAFIDRGGKDVEGTVMAAEPVVIARDLPADSPFKKVTMDFVQRYKELTGDDPPAFAAHIPDAMTIASTAITSALKTAKPGTPEFRAAIRDGLEKIDHVYLNNGLLTNSPSNHSGYDIDGVFLMKVENGAFHMVK